MNRFGRLHLLNGCIKCGVLFVKHHGPVYSLCTLKTNLWKEILHNLKKMERDIGFFSRCCADMGFRRRRCSVGVFCWSISADFPSETAPTG